jgi:putative oxidoreductase
METLAKAGRVIYGIPFVIFGLFHLTNAKMMAGMVPIPGGEFWIYLTGLCLIAAGVAFIINKQVKLAGILNAVMLTGFILMVHVKGILSDDQMLAMMSTTSLLKDTALAGASLFLAGTLGKTSL